MYLRRIPVAHFWSISDLVYSRAPIPTLIYTIHVTTQWSDGKPSHRVCMMIMRPNTYRSGLKHPSPSDSP